METKNREKLLLIATGVVVALWVLNLIVVSPLIDSWHSRSDEIVKLKQKISDGVALVRREETIRDRWDNMRANALANDTTVADRQLFTAFDHWVSAGGVTEGSFHPQSQEGDTNYSTVDCRSDVSGSLPSVVDFLRAMSKDPLADKVESFELTSKDDNGRQLSLGLSLSGLILTGSDPSTVTLPPKTVEPAPPQETNSAASPNLDPFRLITRNNIFDQSRIYRSDERNIPVTIHRYEMLASCGAAVYNGQPAAFFEGQEVSPSRSYSLGDSVSDLKIAKITPNTVTLTNASSNMFVLPTDKSTSLRREDNGPWTLSGYVATVATPDANTNTNGTASVSSGPKSGSSADAILERLKKRREQE